MKEVKK